MVCARSGFDIRICIALFGGLFAAGRVTAQSDTTIPNAEQQRSERAYAEMVGRVQQGDMTVDFRAFRVAGATKSGPHASKLETEERAAFRSIVASGDWTGALGLAKRALERNYASPIAHYDAMTAYQTLGKTDEAAVHEKTLNALLDSIRQSGDGKSPETAYFVVTVQEEYIFLNRVLHIRATSQSWVRKDSHFYDRLLVPDSTTNQIQYLWFNADFDARSDPAAIAAVKDGVLATTTVNRPDAAQETPSAALGGLAQAGASNRNIPRSGTSYAVLTKRIQPEYTPEARAAGLQGSVILYLEVSPTGEAEKVQVIQSLGLGLDEKAIEAVKQWRFKPATIEGKPTKVTQSAEVQFRLDPTVCWRIRRVGYRVNREGMHQVTQISKPELSQYIAPDKQACHSDGGIVIANLQIGKDGKPDHVKLIEAQNEAASDGVLDAIRLWRFQPGVVNGKRREGSGTVEMECVVTQPVAIVSSESAEVRVYQIGQGISLPAVVYKVEPEYSEEARRAKFQGTVIISVLIDVSGHAGSMRVVRPLGLELDEKAMEAINLWRFKPATKDGKPVIVTSVIEVNFRLL